MITLSTLRDRLVADLAVLDRLRLAYAHADETRAAWKAAPELPPAPATPALPKVRRVATSKRGAATGHCIGYEGHPCGVAIPVRGGAKRCRACAQAHESGRYLRKKAAKGPARSTNKEKSAARERMAALRARRRAKPNGRRDPDPKIAAAREAADKAGAREVDKSEFETIKGRLLASRQGRPETVAGAGPTPAAKVVTARSGGPGLLA